MRLTLYVKAHCSLCDAAREAVDDALCDLGLDVPVEEVDIAGDPALLARYGLEIPVLEIDGLKAFALRFDPAALHARLSTELSR